MTLSALPVGVFDSGLGGLTAVREIRKILPHEDIIYFGDTGRLPYGTRSPKIIREYASDDMTFLSSFHVKAVCVACGTVSSTSLPTLSERFDTPLVGVVEPAAAAAVRTTKNGRIGVLATPSTTRSESFARAVKTIKPDAGVMGVGCPLFVPLVENGYIEKDDPVTRIIAREYVSKLKDFAPDVIILGCTHYPIIRALIEEAAEELIGGVTVIDAGKAAAEALKAYLTREELLNENGSGSTSFYVSDDPDGFERVASVFLGETVESAVCIDIGQYRYADGKDNK